MRDDRARGRVAVVAGKGGDDGAVLADGGIGSAGAIAAGQPHGIDQGGTGFQHGDRHAVVRQRVDGTVEGAVRRGECGRVARLRCLLMGALGFAHGLQRGRRGPRGGLARGQRLQGAAHGIEFAQRAAIQRRQGGAAMRAQHHHAIARQVQQRLADRALADAIAAFQFGERQVRADRPCPCRDVGQHLLPHAQIGGGGEGGVHRSTVYIL